MKTRFLSVLVVVVLLFGTLPFVSAQGGPDLTCVGLSEADCAILTDAMAKSEEIESFYMDFAVDFALSNLGAIAMMFGETGDVGDITLNVAGEGPFMLDMEAVPPARMALSIEAAMDDGTTSEGGTLEMVMADGVIYISEDGSTWEGMTFEDAMASMDPDSRAMIEGLLGGDLSQLPEGALSPDDLGGGSPLAMLEELGLSEEDLMALVNVPDFITQQRLPDEEMMGQSMAVFESKMDLVPLFSSEAFANVLDAVMTAAAEEDPDAAQMGMMVPMLLSGLDVKITQTQYIGLSDGYVHGVALDLQLVFDLSILMGGAESGQEMPPIMADFHFDVMLDQINQSFDIVAPEGAEMVSPSSM
ncbi:MAG: hypothetical protein Kow0077_06410 [Anaerolineae bacterium]